MAEYFVHPEGNDGSAQADDPQQPYLNGQTAIDAANQPGDIVSFINDGVHSFSQFNCPNSGTGQYPIWIRGVNESGVWDGVSKATVNRSGTSSAFTGTPECLVVSDLLVSKGQYVCATDGFAFLRVGFDPQYSTSLFLDGSSAYCYRCFMLPGGSQFYSSNSHGDAACFVECYAFGCLDFAWRHKHGRGGISLLRCIAEACGGGYDLSGSSTVIRAVGTMRHCIALNCGSGAVLGSHYVLVDGCTIVGCGGHGIEKISQTGVCEVSNSIIAYNGGYGIKAPESWAAGLLLERDNIFYANTSGDFEGKTISATSQNADPKFQIWNPAENVYDLRLQSDSPARQRLIQLPSISGTELLNLNSYIDHGALQSIDATGGGGTIWNPNKRGNKQ